MELNFLNNCLKPFCVVLEYKYELMTFSLFTYCCMNFMSGVSIGCETNSH